MAEEVVNFRVVPNGGGNWSVLESGFEKPLAEFRDASTAEEYALRFAESKSSWKIDVYVASGSMTATYDSETMQCPGPA